MRCTTALALTTVLAAAAAPSQAGITDIAGFQGVGVYESTYQLPHPRDFFAAGDARLTSVLAGAALSQAGRDFGHFVGNENYDIYLSNADGTLNAAGSYVTIDGNCDVPYLCFNINEVALVVNGSEQWATAVVRAVYGRAGSYVPGSAARAADGNMSTFTQLGDTIGMGVDARMSITLSFANVPQVPEPGTYALLVAGLAAVGGIARRRAS